MIKFNIGNIAIAAVALLTACGTNEKPGKQLTEVPQHPITYNPEQYIAYQTKSTIEIDGDLTDEEWGNVEWTNEFVDIEGDLKQKPLHSTRAKMMWDEKNFYFAFEMIEPDIWGTLTERDAVIFQDNDIEIFIDPDGDTHHYYEWELNALNTIWDLMLTKPYRDPNMKVLDAWTIRGQQTAVKIYGTLNNPNDTDQKWTVEVALPWSDLEEAAAHNGYPKDGEQWKVDFSRVNWKMDVENGKYTKAINPETGKHYPEFNWVWSPQGVIAMHQPETWGLVQFSNNLVGKQKTSFIDPKDDKLKWAMRQIYYRQKAFFNEYGVFATQASQLKLDDVKVEGMTFNPSISVFNNRWEAKQTAFDGKNAFIQADGRVWIQ